MKTFSEDDCEDFLDPNGFLLPSEEDDESEVICYNHYEFHCLKRNFKTFLVILIQEECKPDTSFPSSDLDKAENPKKAKTEGQVCMGFEIGSVVMIKTKKREALKSK